MANTAAKNAGATHFGLAARRIVLFSLPPTRVAGPPTLVVRNQAVIAKPPRVITFSA
jgi:hypothetical protein